MLSEFLVYVSYKYLKEFSYSLVFLELLQELPKDKWFCCSDCSRIHLTMQSLVLKGTEMVPASVLDAVYKKHLGKGLTDGAANSMQWRILSGKSRNPEHLALLSRAAAIFRVCLTILPSVVLRLSKLIQ